MQTAFFVTGTPHLAKKPIKNNFPEFLQIAFLKKNRFVILTPYVEMDCCIIISRNT